MAAFPRRRFANPLFTRGSFRRSGDDSDCMLVPHGVFMKVATFFDKISSRLKIKEMTQVPTSALC